MEKYKRYEQVGDAILLLINNYSEEKKKQIKKGLESYIFIPKAKTDPIPHPNSLEAKGEPEAPKNHIEALLILMNPLYNTRTANNIRKYVLNKLEQSSPKCKVSKGITKDI